jgi:hypothetical protein
VDTRSMHGAQVLPKVPGKWYVKHRLKILMYVPIVCRTKSPISWQVYADSIYKLQDQKKVTKSKQHTTMTQEMIDIFNSSSSKPSKFYHRLSYS